MSICGWLRWPLGATVILVAILAPRVGSVPLAGSALAATTCQGGLHYHFDGISPVATTSYGISANIDTLMPSLCTTGNNNSAVYMWTMLADSGSGAGWAQSGYETYRGLGNVYYFAQSCAKYSNNNCTSGFSNWQGGVASGAAQYEQLYNFNTGKIDMSINGTVKLSTSFDPIVAWTAPWVPEWEGETHDSGDDIPGLSTSPTNWTNMQYDSCRTGCWSSPSSHLLTSDVFRYGAAWVIRYTTMALWHS